MTTHDAHRRGRPSKFGRPSQPVTITLPDDIVAAFRAIDPDLSRAIVHVAEAAGAKLVPRPAVELTRYGHSAVIVLKPNKAIEQLPGVALVPLPDGRALISLDKDKGIAEFEVLVRDALDSDATPPADRAMLQQLGDILRSARGSRQVRLRQRNIIVLETTTRRTAAASRAAHGSSKEEGETER
jgi:hypothetical protein